MAVFPAKHTTSSTTFQIWQDDYLVANDEVTNKLYNEWLKKKVSKKGFNSCSCVSVAKSLTGFDKPVGLAKNWPVNSKWPQVGGVVITREGGYTGHTAVIMGIENNNLILDEGNYVRCKRTKGRQLPIDSSLIIGFWNP